MSQILYDVSTTRNYALNYFYNSESRSEQDSVCTLFTTIDGTVVDAISSSTPGYVSKTIPLPLFSANTVVLKFSSVCPSTVSPDNYSLFLLDAITITLTN
jgi:hypothetical protein